MIGLFRVGVLCLFAWCVAPGPAQGAPADHQFSADLVTIGPQGVLGKGKLYVGDPFTRTELTQGGRPVVRILDERTGHAYVLNPAQDSYIEQVAPSPMQMGTSFKGMAAKGPCSPAADTECRELGESEIEGRRVVERELVGQGPQGKELRMHQWIDAERGLVLRSESSSGDRTELSLIGNDSVGSRLTEKWEVAVTGGGGSVVRSYLWYDPALEVVVREELPSGYARELTNIRIGTQPGTLFSVPRGYKKIQLGHGGSIHGDSK